jgi:hypothetical protein
VPSSVASMLHTSSKGAPVLTTRHPPCIQPPLSKTTMPHQPLGLARCNRSFFLSLTQKLVPLDLILPSLTLNRSPTAHQ